MFAIQCDSIDHAAEVFTAMRASVLTGDLDEQLSKASAEIKTRFESKK